MISTVDNHGERLVPGESHNAEEAIRHKSSYQFFKAIIEADSPTSPRILDLGCGVGHGALTLSDIPGSKVVAIDASLPAIEYAKANYAADNIDYISIGADEFLRKGETFDYIVSRHALEHIPDGLELAARFNFTKRLLVNVPYMEPALDAEQLETNPHHELNDINEEDFKAYLNPQFFFEDLAGVTHETAADANSIICASRVDSTPPIALDLPFAAWKPSKLEDLAFSRQEAVLTLNEELTRAHQINKAIQDELVLLRDAYGRIEAKHNELLASRAVQLALKVSRVVARLRMR